MHNANLEKRQLAEPARSHARPTADKASGTDAGPIQAAASFDESTGAGPP
ncbi:MAG: hypothetical protein ABL908_05470 [Hyphomicrobium sp.]